MGIDGRLLGILATLAMATSVGAQGLGDAAKRESERRKAEQQKAAPVKSYSDQDLPSSQAGSAVAEEAAEEAAEAPEEAAAEGTPKGGGSSIFGLPTARSGRTVKAAASGSSPHARESSSSSESYGNNPGSEASWRAAASGARRRVEAAEKRVQELDTKAAGLMYAPTGDCNLGSAAAHMTYEEIKNYKCVDAAGSWQGERQRTLDELEKAKAELEKARKDQETMQESARRQGALPGWLRE